MDIEISIRDYFAAHCPESELPNSITEGDIMRELNIPDQNGQRLDREFRRQATVILRCRARYEYADRMIEASLYNTDFETEESKAAMEKLESKDE